MNILIFLYGLIIGSFLNVCIYRIPREESIAFPSSHCPTCSTSLKWYDNIPLFSYLSIKGKCRYCGSKISIQYPAIEILNAIIFIILFYYFHFSLDFVFYALVSSVLVVITFIDLKEMIIPDVLVLIILILSVLYKTLNYFLYNIPFNTIGSILGLLIAGGIFLLIIVLSKGGMGGGDMTLIAALGFILGVKYILLTIFISFLLGAVMSIGLLVTKVKTKKDPIPFGPFIILAFFIVVLYGEQLINIYWSIMS